MLRRWDNTSVEGVLGGEQLARFYDSDKNSVRSLQKLNF